MFATATWISARGGLNANRAAGPLSFRSVYSGEHHTCGLTTDGAAYCWGLNPFGQLGAQSAEKCKLEGVKLPCSTRPVAVGGGLRFAALAIGGFEHTCGLTDEGRAYCWGLNTFGELGPDSLGTLCELPGQTPIPCARVPMPVASDLRFASIVAGGYHICGLTPDGSVYCWGINDYGQLGNDSGAQLCHEEGRAYPCRRTPLRVRAHAGFTSLTSGSYHNCALDSRGAAYCWGWGFTSAAAEVPGTRFASLSAGDRKTCGLTSDGIPYCWGLFGTPPFEEAASRKVLQQPLRGGIWPAGTDTTAWRFTSVTIGLDHVCGLDSSGVASCWGDGRRGELGTGKKRGSDIPVPVAGGLVFATLSAGGFYTCGVTRDGGLYCWGSNDQGQLGDGSTRDRAEPTLVAQPSQPISP
jgi:alpha-tubulin suppressor-like RCC1 family protein